MEKKFNPGNIPTNKTFWIFVKIWMQEVFFFYGQILQIGRQKIPSTAP